MIRPALTVVLVALVLGSVPTAQRPAAPVTLGARIAADGSWSLLVSIPAVPVPIDEVRLELPDDAARTAVLMAGPAGWQLVPEGRWVRLSGQAAAPPIRLRIAVFEASALERVNTRVRAGGRNLFDGRLDVAALASVTVATTPTGLLALPGVVSGGDTIEASVLNPSATPPDGVWIIAGVPARLVAQDRLSVQLPVDLPPGAPLRVTYFDPWGERRVDALTVDDLVVAEPAPAPATTPRIASCSRFGFAGDALCVCGDFPEASRAGIRIDGQPATVIAASRYVIHVRLPDAIAPGGHVVSGNPGLGFRVADRVPLTALRLHGQLDGAAIERGQSTTLRIGLEGTADRLKLVVTNRTPEIIALPGGNYQELTTAGGPANTVERQVDATGRGEFQIEYRLDGPPCPCTDERRVERASNASQPAPLVVARRVLAMIPAASPAAMVATSQAIAREHNLLVTEIRPIVTADAGLVLFEIADDGTVESKAAALAADARVAHAQPDFVYDTAQSHAAVSEAAETAYGPRITGVDQVHAIGRGGGIRVALIDTGVDTGHEALAGRVAQRADITGTGWTPDVHGTLMAGIIAAGADENGAARGVAPTASLVAIKACVPDSSRRAAARCWSSTLALGIDRAGQLGARVVTLGVSGPLDPLLTRLISRAAARGITVVAAAGNDGALGAPSHPAALDEVIAVTAVDASARPHARATRGTFVDVAAPGVNVSATAPGSRMQNVSGTSAAAAFVAGAAALLLEQRPALSPADVAALLRDTARDLGPAGPDATFGHGLLNVCRAVAKAAGRDIACR
jgi:hypothetical protein